MKRGDIVSVAGKGDFSTKPRPALVVQSDLFNEHHPSVTVCPITSFVTGATLYRVPIRRDEENGLEEDSEIEIDRVQAIWRWRVRQRIGRASGFVALEVEHALRRWLDL